MQKKTNFPATKKYQISIPSFQKGISLKYDPAFTNLDYASNIENFSFDTGALADGIGFDSLFSHIASSAEAKLLQNDIASAGGIEKIIYFYKYNSELNKREDKIVFISSGLEVYYVNLYAEIKQLSKLRTVSFTSLPVALRYRLDGEDVLIFSSETDNMVVWDGTNNPYEVLDTPNISSMAVHFERLFATVDGEKNSVWFSDELDPTEWSVSLDDAGFIELVDERGALQKVVSFNDYIYIFREYGISRLSAFGDQTQFSCSNLYVSSGKINPDSVCVCGDKILFLSNDGLYKFDGVDTVKILDSIDAGFKNLDNQKAMSCFYDSSYFLACNFMDNNGIYLNTILEIDTENYRLKNIVKGVDVKFITSIVTNTFSGVVAIVRQNTKNAFSICKLVKNGSFLGVPTKKVWKSQTTNIGDSYSKKVLRNIYIEAETPIILRVFSDGTKNEFVFSSKSFQSKKCIIFGNEFYFEVECNHSNCLIKNLKFDFYKLERNPLWIMEKQHI